MEELIVQSFVQASTSGSGWGTPLCAVWSWAFWVGIVVGIVGACALFFTKPGEGA